MEKQTLNIDTKEVAKPIVDAGLKEEMIKNPSPEETLAKKENIQKVDEKKKTLMSKIQSLFAAKPFSKLSEKEKNKYMLEGDLQIKLHKNVIPMFEKLQKENPEKAEKFQVAMGRFQYAKWSDEENDYIDAGSYTVAAGEGTSGK